MSQQSQQNVNEKYILCVGMCVLDIIHVCDTFPSEDSDRRSKYGRWQRGGNASNNCTVLSQLGRKCEFFGILSKEKLFKFVIDDMSDQNIRHNNCINHECDSPLSSVLLNEATGSRTIIHSNPNMPILTYNDFHNQIKLNEYQWIHFEGRNPEETIKMMEMITDWNNSLENPLDRIQISLDMEKTRFDLLPLVKYVDLVFLGKDLAKYYGSTDMKSAVESLREMAGNKKFTIICPWGTCGVGALNKNNEYFSCQSYSPLEIIDTLGAGDTFAAAIIHAISSGRSIRFAIEFASRIAGAKCGFYGYDKISNICSDIFNKILD